MTSVEITAPFSLQKLMRTVLECYDIDLLATRYIYNKCFAIVNIDRPKIFDQTFKKVVIFEKEPLPEEIIELENSE